MSTRATLILATLLLGVFMMAGCQMYSISDWDQAKNFQKAENFQEAIAKYSEFVTANQDSTLVPYAMYNIALCYQSLYDKAQALAAFQKLINRFPASDPAEWARVDMKRLEKMELTPPAQ